MQYTSMEERKKAWSTSCEIKEENLIDLERKLGVKQRQESKQEALTSMPFPI